MATDKKKIVTYTDASTKRYINIKAAERGISASKLVEQLIIDFQARDLGMNQGLHTYYTDSSAVAMQEPSDAS